MEQVRKASLALPGVTGTVRMGATADVVARLRPGDLAIIDHPDLDGDRASALVETGARVVLNVGPFVTGRAAPPPGGHNRRPSGWGRGDQGVVI